MAKKTKQKKIFVLDTNVVLYDFQSIYSFDDNIVVIPITLLEEIDKFKRGNEIINYNAREFARELDIIFGDSLLSDGVKLDTGEEIVVSTNTNFDEKLKNVFWEDKPDHRILSVAFNLAIEKGAGNVFLVSKDINLRMKAKSVGIHAQDYETGKIKDIDELYSGKNLVEHIQSEVIDEIYKSGYIELDKSGVETKPLPNEYFILRNGNKSILTVFHDETKTFRQVEKMRAYGITPRNAEQAFALNALMNPEVSLVTLSGKAGTGKTLMALAAALQVRRSYQQILLARPIVPLSNRDIGYLPGDVSSKLDPYMQPLFDNLTVIKHQFKEESTDFTRIN
ncbi:MAG: ribonuclease, partial [Bacteroidetes bacterium]|nr:ribonuclease [Bacteroidota bacterium]